MLPRFMVIFSSSLLMTADLPVNTNTSYKLCKTNSNVRVKFDTERAVSEIGIAIFVIERKSQQK